MAVKPISILIKARDEASGIFSSLQGKVAAVGLAVASYFGISSFIGAVKGAAELESKLAEVRAVSGATAAEMVLLRKAAEDAGATTKFTATEGADALGNLARAGLNAKDAIAALPATLLLAQAGGVGLAEAAGYITKTVAGMSLKFTDAGRVADVLSKGANAADTNVIGLAQAMSYAAPIANSLGLSLETTVAIIGKFADGGIDASRAGTALNAMMSQFADPASRFRQELASAGIITTNFETALRQLAAAGPAGEKAITAVGTEAGPALRALLNQGIGALDDLKGKLDAAKGSAAATAAIMEDSLSGSFNTLSSSWDTVKNALATPVLPVLRQGVTQLSDALTRAVTDGTIGKFGDAIATAFQGGLKWAREFLGTVDFAELTTRMSDFATRTQEVFTQIGDYATNASNIVKTAYGVMSAGSNGVLTAIYGIGFAFTEISAGIVKGTLFITEALQKIAIGSAKQRLLDEAAEIRVVLGGLGAVSEELNKKANDAFLAMADGAQTARDGWAGLTADTSAAASQAATSTQVFKAVSETLKEVGGDATAVGQKAQAAGILQKEAADTARVAVAQLKVEYEAALAAGNVQLALEKLQAMQGALKATSDQAKLTAQDIEGAFTRLGVTSSAELTKTSENAVRDYKIIKDSGTATARDIQEAFKKVAAAATAANNGVTPEWVKTEAAVRGVTGAIQDNAKATVEGSSSSVQAIDRVTQALIAQAEAARSAGLAALKSKYARPGEDPTGDAKNATDREKRLSGQNYVDNSFQFLARDALERGTLDKLDPEVLAELVQTLKLNERRDADLRRNNPGYADPEGYRDIQQWKVTRSRIESYLAGLKIGGSQQTGGQNTGTANTATNTTTTTNTSTPAATNQRSVFVNINTPKGPERVYTDDAGARALVRSLTAASQSAR